MDSSDTGYTVSYIYIPCRGAKQTSGQRHSDSVSRGRVLSHWGQNNSVQDCGHAGDVITTSFLQLTTAAITGYATAEVSDSSQ